MDAVLRVLADPTRRSPLEKLHFLNPVPIQLVHDRLGEQVRQALDRGA